MNQFNVGSNIFQVIFHRFFRAENFHVKSSSKQCNKATNLKHRNGKHLSRL